MDEVFARPTKDSMILNMEQLRIDMLNVSVELEYFGGFNPEFSEKAKGLIAASNILKGWIEDIEDYGANNGEKRYS